jgi:hypothetical protein
MVKNIDIKTIIADIKAGIEKATETKISKEKIVSDLQDFCVDLCNIKKTIADMIDCINIDAITDNNYKIKRQYKLQSVLTDLQSCIESITDFCADNR